MKLLRIGLISSVVLYAACVGMLALLRSRDFLRSLKTQEMLYGPAITIACGWIIFIIAYALVGRKKTDA